MIFECPDCDKIIRTSKKICPECGAQVNIFSIGGGERISKDLGVPFLGRIPLDPEICRDSDKGSPFIIERPNSSASIAFMGIVAEIENSLHPNVKR